MANLFSALSDRQFQSDIGVGIKDVFLRSLAGIAGMPMDLSTMASRPFGYARPDADTMGTSENIQRYMQNNGLVTAARNPTAEFLGALTSPDPTDLVRAAVIVGKAMPKLRAVDVFGNGSRIDHFDDASGLMYTELKTPAGAKIVDVFKPHEKFGFNVPLRVVDRSFSSLEDAVSGLGSAKKGQAISDTYKLKYGAIPKEMPKEARAISKRLIDSGFDVDFVKSGKSKSAYAYINTPDQVIKVRMSDHDLPQMTKINSAHDAADIDYRYGADVSDLINRIKALAER